MNDNFLKNHADTLAIIGVNIAIAAILIMMTLSNWYGYHPNTTKEN